MTRLNTGVIALMCCLPVALLLSCSDSSDRGVPPPPEPPEPGPLLSARLADESDLLGGPLARGRAGDYLLENDRFRVIIQKPGRQWLNIGTYGGNIIDVAARKSDGSFYPDHLEEFVVGINIENTPNYTEVRVVSDGSDGEEAVICATGPDDIFEYANPSSAIRGLGFPFPESADDRDLPLEIETCYRLGPGQPYLTMDTTLRNTSAQSLEVYHVEYLSGSGQVEPFQPQAGFGLPQVNPACPEQTRVSCSGDESGQCDQCNYIAYSGFGGASGVSYGFIHGKTGSSSFSDNGINVLVLGQDVLTLLATQAPPNYTVPAQGELTLQRYFAVGDGTASSIADIRNDLFGFDTGELSGRVTSGGEPLVGAQVAVYQGDNGDSVFMAGHARTDVDGRYSMTLPPGEYSVRANKEGYLFDPDDPRAVAVKVGETVDQEFDLPAPGYLEVTVVDQDGPVPAKLQLVGFDPSPPLVNRVSISQAGVFGDVSGDGLPHGVALVEFIGAEGASDRIAVEPGDYQLVLSRGPRYSAYKRLITIGTGQVTTVQAEIVQVVDTPGFVHGDFHVHGIDSHDSRVTREDRVSIYLAEGMDFFTPSDHDVRVDYSGTIDAMGVSHLLATAPSAEVTTYDTGHFNSWPVSVDGAELNGGSIDWGRSAQPGMDFVEYGSFGLSPREIIDGLLADPRDNIVQINHISSHFGPGGLAIDTGATPPRSEVELLDQRLDPALGNAFDDGFDALEVWIGTNGLGGIDDFMKQNAGDWFNLINQGIARTGVADSDSHDRRFTRISARTLIASDVDDPGSLSGRAEQLAASLKSGRSTGTNAPFLLVSAHGSRDGEDSSAGLGVSENPLIAVDSGTDVELRVAVDTPLWAQVDRLEFYINNQPQRTTPEGSAARYGVCADAVLSRGDPGWQTEDVVVEESVPGAVRTEVRAQLTLPAVDRDTWVVVIARGSNGVSEPLFPVLPAGLQTSSNQRLEDLIDGNLGEGGTPAFAFTNPLYIDVGGDGWVPPGVRNGPCEAPQ
jgi:hypothetical protein